jgi:hypothetical protein
MYSKLLYLQPAKRHAVRSAFPILTALIVAANSGIAMGQMFLDPVESTENELLPSSPEVRNHVPGAFMFAEPEPPRELAPRVLSKLDVWDGGEKLKIKDPNDPRRHVGVGEPLEGTSWMNRPHHVGWLFGGQLGAELDGATQDGGALGGYRMGWDLSHYWGAEITFAFSKLGLEGIDGASRNFFYDLRANYYPLGDARWRPYFGTGLGMSSITYVDELDTRHSDTHMLIPLAMGLKYQCKPWLALRFEVTDFISFGDIGVVNSFSLNAGVEVHYGAKYKTYGPWNM